MRVYTLADLRYAHHKTQEIILMRAQTERQTKRIKTISRAHLPHRIWVSNPLALMIASNNGNLLIYYRKRMYSYIRSRLVVYDASAIEEKYLY